MSVVPNPETAFSDRIRVRRLAHLQTTVTDHLSDPYVLGTMAYVAIACYLYPGNFIQLVVLYSQKFLPFFVSVLLLYKWTKSVFCYRGMAYQHLAWIMKNRWKQIIFVPLYFILVISAFTTFKIHIPDIAGFHLDPVLADIDDRLFGRDAWSVAHLLGNDIALFVEISYSDVWFAPFVAALLVATASTEGNELKRYLRSLMVSVGLLGTFFATLMASAGPVLYDRVYHSSRFVHLDSLISQTPDMGRTLYYSSYLFSNYLSQAAQLGTGISAMPSMHVAISVLNAWFFTSRSAIQGALAWAYAVLIIFGSIYTGWHYASDGIVSFVVVSALWIGISAHLKQPLLPESKNDGMLVFA